MKPKIYFTSDWHIGHENVLKFDQRPFKSLDDMHKTLVKNFNHYVPPHGITYFLGDMGLRSFELLKSVITQLNGTKILIRGNHDGNHYSMYNAGFDVVLDLASIKIGKYIVTMSHCPLRNVYREDTSGMHGCDGTEYWHGHKKHKYTFSTHDFGQFHIHGHIHSSPNKKKSKRIASRQFDVGIVASNYKPVSISEIESWITKHLKENKYYGYYD